MIISFASEKGGVSKTTVCVNLAASISNSIKNKKVLIIDFDPQGAASLHLGMHPKKSKNKSIKEVLESSINTHESIVKYNKRLHFIPSCREVYSLMEHDFSSSFKQALQELQKSYAYIFIDLPPTLSNFTLIPLSFSDGCIIPIYAKGGLSLLGLQNQLDTFSFVQKQFNSSLELIGIVFSMVSRTRLSKEVVEWTNENYPEETFKAAIRENTKVAEAASVGKTIFDYSKSSIGSKDYAALGKEFLQRLKRKKS